MGIGCLHWLVPCSPNRLDYDGIGCLHWHALPCSPNRLINNCALALVVCIGIGCRVVLTAWLMTALVVYMGMRCRVVLTA
jgi:hypothetical protein